ncbi:MAG: HD domain-containing protein [Desulfobacula sp.]|nr:HD domain-containing protein [Desulfobacula sp.]
MNEKLIIKEIERLVKNHFLEESSGHDWWHSHRVRQMGLQIAKNESADLFIVEVSALLHDVGDYKFHDGDEEIGGKIINKWLINIGIPPKHIDKILEIIVNLSFMKSLKNNRTITKHSLPIEAKILNDSDRLDALGAIGIARTFAFGGFFKREIHNPIIPPNINITHEEYKKKNSTSINHFYEKLLTLKDTMLTTTGKKLAQERHEYMKTYLDRFFDEWDGTK